MLANQPNRALTGDTPMAGGGASNKADEVLYRVLTGPGGNNAPRWKPGERFHHLFEQQVCQFRQAGKELHKAVLASDREWTYIQLDEYANRLARYLLSLGVKAGEVVGLLFDKSVHAYAAMLAVSKIHAAWAPLDPAFPAERIGFISRDAGLTRVLTVAAFEPLIGEAGLSAVALDKRQDLIQGLVATALSDAEAGSPVTDLCYIIYTSGSSGRPKGVPIAHRSICNFVRVAGEFYGYCDSDRVYQGLTIAFDFSVEEIWAPLACGATLAPNQTGNSLIGEELGAFLHNKQITALCCVPTLLATIDQDLPDLRLLIVSGEACPQDLVERWATDSRRMLNAYGPTETTVTATLAELRPGDPVTIGKPLPTYSVMILDPESLTVLPFGEEGEIAIAGIGVAEGYLHREAQTRRAFITDFLNLPDNPSGLIYRSGDLGLIDADGNIEYRGRIDQQVKIRGYRIELSEIESVIMSQPGISQAAVATFEPAPGIKELVAFYSLQPGVTGWSETQLRDALREVLPAYMNPACFEQLDALPMMASDKVDRKALPTPSAASHVGGDRPTVAPRNHTEEKIATALASLLGMEVVSVRDDFFAELGCSSLLMASFCSAVRQALPGVEISMRDVYAHPSVEKLAVSLKSSREDAGLAPPMEQVHSPTITKFFLCGALQLASYLVFLVLALAYARAAAPWLISASDAPQLYLRTAGLLAITLIGWSSLSIAAKWLVIGRWKVEAIPIWSLRYFRFWLMKKIILSNPLTLFRGYPLFNLYLRLMGAKIGRNVVIQCRHTPLCADLLQVGDNTILRNDSLLVPYKAGGNFIRTGGISLGRDVVVGEGSVVDIDTSIGDGGRLEHASCLLEGQCIAPGQRCHGNPAETVGTAEDDRAGDCGDCGNDAVQRWRVAVYSGMQLFYWLAVAGPVVLVVVVWLQQYFSPGSAQPWSGLWLVQVSSAAVAIFALLFVLGLIRQTIVPRLLHRMIEPGRSYHRYGFHFALFRLLQRSSHAPGFHLLFGDSSAIVHYMRLVGYRLGQVVQTGSNFGLEHRHDNPLLCCFGTGTMISDGFYMLNVEESVGMFCMREARVGRDNFVGNNVYFPPAARTGDDCLIATKAMVPVDGPMREHVGLLGSPCFEIPRHSGEDGKLSAQSVAAERRVGLPQKNRHNMITAALVLGSGFAPLLAALLMLYSLAPAYQHLSLPAWVGIAVALTLASTGWLILLERAAYSFGRMTPATVSIYNRQYWQVERVWKFSETRLRKLWLGTPFRTLINRLLGMRVGRMVFDDGLYASEKTLVEIGDYSNFNRDCVLQSHSLEDGIYKSDHIRVGNGCTLEARVFVHYGAVLEDDVIVLADAFVMKGERLQKGSRWAGNPAAWIADPAADG